MSLYEGDDYLIIASLPKFGAKSNSFHKIDSLFLHKPQKYQFFLKLDECTHILEM
jgi:hypothetical protein